MSVKLTEIDGTESWIDARKARKLIRDGLVDISSQKPLSLKEKPRIRRMFTSRYMEGFRKYRDELAGMIMKARTGKPLNSVSEEYREIERLKNDRYQRTPHGFGR